MRYHTNVSMLFRGTYAEGLSFCKCFVFLSNQKLNFGEYLKSNIPEVTNFGGPLPSPRPIGDLYSSKSIQKYLKNSHVKFHLKIFIRSKNTDFFKKKN